MKYKKQIEFMRIAIEESEKSTTERGKKISPKVGAVLVKNGKVLEKAFRGESAEGEHAEYTLLELKCSGKNLKDTILFVTLEPCTRRNPPKRPCVEWIRKKGIKEVIIGTIDPNPLISGRGYLKLRELGINVEFSPSQIRNEIESLNKDFRDSFIRPSFATANQLNEKGGIWTLIDSLITKRDDKKIYWYCGQSGIGKTALLRWVREVLKDGGEIEYDYITLGNNEVIFPLMDLVNGNISDLDVIKANNGNIIEYVCNKIVNYLRKKSKPKIIILDTDYQFNDYDGLSKTLSVLKLKIETFPQYGIIVATKKCPKNHSYSKMEPLSEEEIEEMYKIKGWEYDSNTIKNSYKITKGNPLFVVLYNALVKIENNIRSNNPNNLQDIIYKIFECLPNEAQAIIKNIVLSLKAPYELEKLTKKELILPETEEAEKWFDFLVKYGIIQSNSPKISIHDDIIESFEDLISDDEKNKIHNLLGNRLIKSDPISSLWHFVRADNYQKAFDIIVTNPILTIKNLEVLKFIKIYSETAKYFENLTKDEKNKEIKPDLLYYMGLIFFQLAEFVDKSKNLTKTRELNELLIINYNFENQPEIYGHIYNNLGAIYGNMAENAIDKKVIAEKALNYLENALNYRESDKSSIHYGETQNNLGAVYRILAETKMNVNYGNKAIESYKKALKIYTLEKFPQFYGRTQSNLAHAYVTLADIENKKQNSLNAIEAGFAALKVFSLERYSILFAGAKNNLGIAYRTLAEVENITENCKKAIEAYKDALQVYSFENFPLDYAMVQSNLAGAYSTLALEENIKENYSKSTKAYENALKVYTVEKYPILFAKTEYNIGYFFYELGMKLNNANFLKKSIDFYKKSAKYRNFENFPAEYASTQNNLGLVYLILANSRDKEENCKKAINSYEEALKFYKLNRFPDKFGSINNNIGISCLILIELSKSEKYCKKGMKAFNFALEFYKKELYPEQYEGIIKNLKKIERLCGKNKLVNET